MTLVQAPKGVVLRIAAIAGGESVHRRLMSLGFHEGDRIEAAGRGIMGGPVLLRNLDSGVTAAVGRGIAAKIRVEAIDERPQ
ncbi:MAG: FeoA family protein [Candidatus Aminicenantes bacterium]|nr:FeoA family protein [Candidatus Aminicenantes bacterium]